MNYDGLLSQLTDEKLSLLQTHTVTAHRIPIEEGAIEEEQPAQIQNVLRNSPLLNLNDPNNAAGAATMHTTASTTTTPQRKISASSRFMNAFQQFYTGASSSTNITGNNGSNSNSSNSNSNTVVATAEDCDVVSRTPTKGMESKLMSMWHNMKYGWSGKIRSSFSKEQPVWLLGRCYHRKSSPPRSMENSIEFSLLTTTANATCSVPAPTNPQEMVEEIVVPQELGTDCAADNQLGDQPWEEGIEGFRRDFYTRIWMTYRREFPTMNGTNYTSDCGWGCMLRSGQMLLAQALVCHFLGRTWRYDPETQIHATYEDTLHKKIIKWFGDSSSKSSPFSIHCLVRLGEEMGKKPGDWYGPASVSFLLKQALKNAAQENADFDNIAIYVARDCTIYMQDVEETCQINEPAAKPNVVPWQSAVPNRKTEPSSSPIKQQWKSLIVLIPLRLGNEKLNPIYAHCLKLLLSTEYCIGIIGGRPKHSLYFVGFQEDKLIHLDPHYCQEMVDVNQEIFPLNSFHCKSPRKLKSSKMDPSCCIGFYCQTKADFDGFIESVQLYLNPMRCASGTYDRVLPPAQQMPSTSNSPLYTNEPTSGGTEMNYPLFSFSRGRCSENDVRDEMSDSLYKPAAFRQISQLSNASAFCNLEDEDSETEEFVLL